MTKKEIDVDVTIVKEGIQYLQNSGRIETSSEIQKLFEMYENTLNKVRVPQLYIFSLIFNVIDLINCRIVY